MVAQVEYLFGGLGGAAPLDRKCGAGGLKERIHPPHTMENRILNMSTALTTSTWSLKLIFRPKTVLISTTKPPNMSFKLQMEVVEPEHDL